MEINNKIIQDGINTSVNLSGKCPVLSNVGTCSILTLFQEHLWKWYNMDVTMNVTTNDSEQRTNVTFL